VIFFYFVVKSSFFRLIIFSPFFDKDVGSGIGRIAKLLFVPLEFSKIDIMDQNRQLLEEAKKFINSPKCLDNLFCSGMQNFNFTEQYDLIWIQWVSIYLTDFDFVDFFSRCRKALNTNGVIVLKENISNHGFIVDKEDNSITRFVQLSIMFIFFLFFFSFFFFFFFFFVAFCSHYFLIHLVLFRTDDFLRALLRKSGLKILKIKQQMNFPKELFPVKMYACVDGTDQSRENDKEQEQSSSNKPNAVNVEKQTNKMTTENSKQEKVQQ
jgi:hypothetical protein